VSMSVSTPMFLSVSVSVFVSMRMSVPVSVPVSMSDFVYTQTVKRDAKISMFFLFLDITVSEKLT